MSEPIDPNQLRLRLESLDWLPAGFERKLREQSGWTPDEVSLALREYARFLFLAIRMGGAVPSKAIDSVWHLHLLHTRSYWGSLCQDILGRPLHHEPGSGTDGDEAIFRSRYARTILEYQKHFGIAAPELFWPREKPVIGSMPSKPETVLTRFVRRYFSSVRQTADI